MCGTTTYNILEQRKCNLAVQHKRMRTAEKYNI